LVWAASLKAITNMESRRSTETNDYGESKGSAGPTGLLVRWRGSMGTVVAGDRGE
jgi:hypothetical protein